MHTLLKTLVDFRTVTMDQTENHQALNWVETRVKKYLYAVRYRSRGFSSLIATSQRTKKTKLWLAAHMDVVPGSEKLFHPKRVDNNLFGRGSYDMKFAIACYLRLVQELKTDAKNYNFGVMLTSDEEIGGAHGTKFLLDQGYRGNLAFLPDGGENWKLEKAAKGLWHLHVSARGKSQHGSQPWLGENAIVRLMEFLCDLEKLFPQEPCGDSNHYHHSLSIGHIEGGESTNQIPDYACAFIDIRHTPEISKTKLWKKIHSIQRRHPRVHIKEITYSPAYENNLALPEILLFQKLARERYGIRMAASVSHGSSDAHYFAQKKIPVLLTTPRGGGHHSENEWIDLKNLEKFYQVLKAWVTRIS